QDAADLFRPTYEDTKRRDGYVSLQVSPLLANDTQGTIEEARRLWKAVGRPNIMIKVPGTREGLPAIRQLLEEGLNINITLLFAQSVYEQVAEAFIAALEARAANGQDLSHIASVASFFVSRIDTLVDNQIEAKLKSTTDAGQRELLASLEGKVAIANAKLTYENTANSSVARAGSLLPLRARKRSASSGPAPAQKIPSTATFSTSKSSSARTPSTPFLPLPGKPSAITASSATAFRKTSPAPVRPCKISPRPASP